MRRPAKVLTACVVVGMMALAAVLVAAVLTTGDGGASNRALCKERLAAAYRTGEHIGGAPPECVGLPAVELERIATEIMTEVPAGE